MENNETQNILPILSQIRRMIEEKALNVLLLVEI